MLDSFIERTQFLDILSGKIDLFHRLAERIHLLGRFIEVNVDVHVWV